MGFVHVDISNLSPEDITGMPIADTTGDDIVTEFSEPNLYITIMKDYNEVIKRCKVEGRRYNVVLLFDEMNRASIPVFNAIRKVLLEKEFDNVKLPNDIIVTGAINPAEIGTIEFTSHTRDVLDIIPSTGDFNKTLKYIGGRNDLQEINEEIGFELSESVTDVIHKLAVEFQSDFDNEENRLTPETKPFWWHDGANIFYVSPREITEAVVNTVGQIEDTLYDMGWDTTTSYTDEQFDEFIDAAVNITAKTFMETFGMIELKHAMDGFIDQLGRKISIDARIRGSFSNIKEKKSANIMTLKEIIDGANGDIKRIDKSVLGSYLKDFTTTEMLQDIRNIFDVQITTLDPDIAMIKLLDLSEHLIKTMAKLNVNGAVKDQLSKFCSSKIESLLKSGSVPLVQVLKHTTLMQRIEKLT